MGKSAGVVSSLGVFSATLSYSTLSVVMQTRYLLVSKCSQTNISGVFIFYAMDRGRNLNRETRAKWVLGYGFCCLNGLVTLVFNGWS